MILGPIVLFSEYKFTTSSGKHLENTTNGRIICLMYKLIRRSKEDSNDLSIGFHHDMGEKIREFRDNSDDFTRGNLNVSIFSRDIFGFAQHKENATYGLGYRLIIKRNIDSIAIVHGLLRDGNREHITLNDISWYVPHNTSNSPLQTLLREHIISRARTQLSYIGRSVGGKPVVAQFNWFLTWE